MQIRKTTLEQLSFITANNPQEEKYEIEKLYIKTYAHAMRNLTGQSFAQGHHYILSRWEFDPNSDVRNETLRFKTYVTRELKIAWEDWQNYYEHSMLFDSYSFRPMSDTNRATKDNPDSFTLSGNSNPSVVHFVMFLVEGKTYDNFMQANDYLKANNVSYDSGSFTLTYGNITMKRYMNGRLDLKGLTDTQRAIINTMLRIREIVRNK